MTQETQNKESKFKVGTIVALLKINSITKTRVAKVYKNGRFTLGGEGNQQFRIYNDGTAKEIGRYHWSWMPAKVEVWSEEHDLKIKEMRERKERIKFISAVQERIEEIKSGMNDYRLTEVEMLSLKAFLEASPAKIVEVK